MAAVPTTVCPIVASTVYVSPVARPPLAITDFVTVYVPPVWPELNAVVEVIHRSSGLAVLAHPDRYGLSPRMMQALFEAFDHAGGDAVEVNAEGRFGSSTQVRLARQFGFALSSGSDFHAPSKGVPDLGDAVEIPGTLPAIWQQLRAAA